ncbi:MAG TPA: nickel pincer cofactor biosynthesis protein LarC [Candidatus Dormibacteraeota bacterium]|nr:nickel pincer cofactor biosynthesis protein LarC [Candidatus Dormibacteraeota bacterium]
MSGTCVHFDCSAGVGGDMLLAALLDAGCPLDPVRDAVRACGVTEAEIGVIETLRAGLRGLLLRVAVHGRPRHRPLSESLAAIAAAGLPAQVAEGATTTLRRLGDCEARLHGIPVDRVELHELGAVDTLVDVVGVCAALHHLGATEVLCSPLPAAPGTVTTEHGVLPLPAPATLALLAEARAPLRPGIPGVEQVTPTAAALLTTLARFAVPAMRLRAVGHGAGSRDDPRRPNLVRCWVGDAVDAGVAAPGGFDDACVELRTNLDDAAPAVVADLAERVLAAGALDAWVVAATMKKGRPGHILHALVPPAAEAAVAALLLVEGPTLGVRRTDAPRMVAERDVQPFASPLGEVRVKRKLVGGRVVDARPELDDCRRLAAATGRPLHQVIDTVSAAARAEMLT